jgi:HEAT repeat protein
VLKESKTPAAVGALMDLLGHESWRVRAEAAEALAKRVEHNGGSGNANEQTADIYARMIKLLDDPDGFVVSRAVLVLRDAKVSAAVDPLAAAAEKRPELAQDVVRALSQAGTSGAVKHLRAFCGHTNPAVRAAAISGLCTAVPTGAGDEVQRALGDDVPGVRLAAARGLAGILAQMRPNANEEVRGFLGMGKPSKRDMEAWLTDFRSGRLRPEWMNGAVGPLEKMLAGQGSGASPEEPVAAAVPLVAMGRDEKALPVLRATAAAGPGAAGRGEAAEALPWLPQESRVALFKELSAKADAGELTELVQEMGKLPSPAATGPMWDMLGSESASPQLVASVHDTFRRLYLGERYYDRSSYTPEKLKPILDVTNQKVADGSPMQQLAALAMLAEVAPESAAPAAEKIIKSRPSGDPLRADAMQVLLLSKPKEQAEHDAVDALAGLAPSGVGADVDWEMKKTAVRFLAHGPSGLRALRGSVWLNVSSTYESFSSGDGQAIVVTAPKGLKPEALRPLLADSDRANAAAAGYLLCVLGERAGFDPLVAYWRESGKGDGDWRRLVYRAIAVLDDDALVPVLEEVYASLGDQGRYYARELYWTIRSIKGPNVLKLRKKIRDDVGMEQLR